MVFMGTNKEFVNRFRYLVFRSRYGHYITRHLGTREVDLAIPFLLEFVDLVHTSDEFSMVQAIDDDGLRDEFRVLYGTTDLSDLCRWLIDRCRRCLF